MLLFGYYQKFATNGTSTLSDERSGFMVVTGDPQSVPENGSRSQSYRRNWPVKVLVTLYLHYFNGTRIIPVFLD